MKIGVVGPPSRICGSTKIAFGQAACLVKRGHEVKLVLQKRGLDQVKRLYTGLSEGVDIIELAPIPFLSPFIDRLTRRYRMGFGGTHVPITQDLWYEIYRSKYTKVREIHKQSINVARETDIDFTAMLLRSPYVSKLLAKLGCTALICYATLMTVPVLQLYAFSGIKKVLYLLDMPISKTLVTEGRPPSSPLVKAVTKFENWVVNHSDILACNNKLTSKEWLEWYGVKLKRIPQGCTPSPYFPLNRSNYVLTVTYWNPDKRPFFFLDLADQLRDSDLLLVMAGHWPNRGDLEEMRKRIKQRNLEEKLRVIAEPTEDELKKLYEHARCFVAPPKSGGYITAGLEAAAFGTPIIYPKVAGVWDIFTAGVHGFIANIQDIEHVVACIKKFEDDGVVYRMGRETWLRAKELSWEAHALAMENLLSE